MASKKPPLVALRRLNPDNPEEFIPMTDLDLVR